MFGKSLYNRQPYNRTLQDGEKIYIRAKFQENILGWTNVGADYYVTHRLNESLMGNGNIAQGIPVSHGYIEELNGHLMPTIGVNIKETLSESLLGESNMGADLYVLEAHASEILLGSAFLSANIYIHESAEEFMDGSIHMGADLYVSQGFYEVLNGYSSAKNISEAIAYLNVSIPPGSVLVIDSDNFRVLLDNENIIAKHSGDWIFIDRNTFSLTMSRIGSINYRWEVFYNAKYL